MQIETPEPGWRATIYAAPPGPAPETVPEGWTKVGGGTVNAKDKSFKLDTGGTAYRYYLVWITKLAPRRLERARSPRSGCSRKSRPRSCRRRRSARPRSARAREPSSRSQSSGNGRPGRLPQLRVDARRREARERVELVDQHALAVLDEEVHARQAGAADAQERVARRAGAPPRARASSQPRGHDELHPARRVLGLVVVPVGAL